MKQKRERGEKMGKKTIEKKKWEKGERRNAEKG